MINFIPPVASLVGKFIVISLMHVHFSIMGYVDSAEENGVLHLSHASEWFPGDEVISIDALAETGPGTHGQLYCEGMMITNISFAANVRVVENAASAFFMNQCTQ